ncbi:MAG: polysaccharide lyase [Gammaproteobacteria bacterium]
MRIAISAIATVGFVAIISVAYALTKAPPPFADNFESGALDDPLWQVDKKHECSIRVTEGIARTGDHALQFNAGPGARCEVVPKIFRDPIGRYRREPFQTERWYRFSTWLSSPWPPNEKNEIIAQWHGTDDEFLGDRGLRGPALAIRIYGNSFHITHGHDANFVSERQWIANQRLWTAPIETDRWLDWLVQARWSWKEDGYLRIWLNGKLIVEHRGPNSYNDLRGVYLKLGPYHPGFRRNFLLDDVHIGDSEPTADTPH